MLPSHVPETVLAPSQMPPQIPTGVPPPIHTGVPPPIHTGMPPPPLHAGIPPPLHAGVPPPIHAGVPPPIHTGMPPPMSTGVPPPVGVPPPISSGVPPPTHGGVPPPLAGSKSTAGGCPPEGALAQPIGVWQPTDQSDVTRPVVESDEEDLDKLSELKVDTNPQGPASAVSPLSPGAGWTTPTDHTHVVDWAAEANNNSSWGLPPTSPSNDMYSFNPNLEAAASASQNWGSANEDRPETEQSKSEQNPSNELQQS